MKRVTNIISLVFLLSVSGNCQNISSNKGVSGTYKYESVTDVPVVIMETELNDSTDEFEEIPVKTEDEYKDRMTLKLNLDSTFELKLKSTGGGSESYDISYGRYLVRDDSLFLYSPLPLKTGKLRKVNGPTPKNLIKISFKGGFDGKKSQIQDFINNIEFYSLNMKFEKTRLNWKYVVPDTMKLNENKKYSDTISFVFNRSDIGAYFLCFNNEKDSTKSNSMLLKMADYKFNNYFVGYEIATEDYFGSRYEYFFDASNYVFLIRSNDLVCTDKNYNEVGKLVNYVFKKID